jgi:hypothetical protein
MEIKQPITYRPRTKEQWIGVITDQPVLKASFSEDLKEMCPLCRTPMRELNEDCQKPHYHTPSRKPEKEYEHEENI